MEKPNDSYIADGDVKLFSHSGKQFSGFFKKNWTCNSHTTQQLHTWAFIQRNDGLFLHKNLYMNIYRHFIHNSSKLETTPMVFNRCMVKQTVTHIYHGTLFSDQQEWTIHSTNDSDENLENCAEWGEKQQARPQSLHTVFPFMQYLETTKL